MTMIKEPYKVYRLPPERGYVMVRIEAEDASRQRTRQSRLPA